MSELHRTNNKRSFPINLKMLLSQAKLKKKYFFGYTLVLILFISLFAPNYIVPFLKASAAGRSIQSSSPSFSFTAGGDIGGNTKSSAALDLFANSSGNFHLVLCDLSYSE